MHIDHCRDQMESVLYLYSNLISATSMDGYLVLNVAIGTVSKLTNDATAKNKILTKS